MSAINKATADIDVQLVFCNAGYILSGFFYSRPVEAVLANIECNAVSAVAITHHFLKRMVRVTCAPAYPALCAAARPLPHPIPTHRDTHTLASTATAHSFCLLFALISAQLLLRATLPLTHLLPCMC